MDSNTLRMGVACLVALTSPASASVQTGLSAAEMECQAERGCDPLIEFLVGTGGDVSEDSVVVGLAAAFASERAPNTAEFPRFLRNLIALGITPGVRSLVEYELSEMVTASSMPIDRKAELIKVLAEVADTTGCVGLSTQSGADNGDGAAACAPPKNAYLT